jgi:hypothetical protein
LSYNRGLDVMISAVVFTGVAILLCAAAVLAIFGVTHVAMSSPTAIEHDGLHRGLAAPAWSLPDASGRILRSPPDKPFQLIVFTDHSLKSFPSVVEGLKTLASEAAHPEIIVLLREDNAAAAGVLRLLGLGDLPVVTGTPSLYGRYNVRVTPFVIFADSAGRVRASSLVNHDWQIMKLWRLANVPLVPDPVPRARRLSWRRLSWRRLSWRRLSWRRQTARTV